MKSLNLHTTIIKSLIFFILGFAGKQLQANCTANFTYQVLQGNQVKFTNTSTGNYYFAYWEFNSTQVMMGSDTNPVFDLGNPGWHRVCLTLKVDSGLDPCSIKCDSIFIPGTSICDANFAFINFNPSTPAPVQLFLNAYWSKGANLVYVWNFGDGSKIDTTNNGYKTHILSDTGTYQICLMVYNRLDPSCKDSTCEIIYIGNKVPCNANFNVELDTLLNPPAYRFKANYSGANTTYLWDFGDGQTSILKNPGHYYSKPGYYRICLTVSNPLDSCFDTVCDTIYIASTTGILSQTTKLNTWQLFPNPVTNELTLLANKAISGSSIRIINLHGQIILEQSLEETTANNTFKINTSGLQKGVYWIQIHNEQTTQMINFIKN